MTAAMFVSASVGEPDNPPERIKVEVCKDCSAIVPVATFDTHGQHHVTIERLATANER